VQGFATALELAGAFTGLSWHDAKHAATAIMTDAVSRDGECAKNIQNTPPSSHSHWVNCLGQWPCVPCPAGQLFKSAFTVGIKFAFGVHVTLRADPRTQRIVID